MYCTPILISDPCNDPTVNPTEFLKVALAATEQPLCAPQVWTVRVLTHPPDCFDNRADHHAHTESLAQTARNFVTHLEAPWLEALAAREAAGTPPANPPTAAEDTSATPPPTEGPA